MDQHRFKATAMLDQEWEEVKAWVKANTQRQIVPEMLSRLNDPKQSFTDWLRDDAEVADIVRRLALLGLRETIFRMMQESEKEEHE